jgi:hypothetical protein
MTDKQLIGWREWLALPGIGIPALKAKIDTGARTSSLHAYFVEAYRDNGREMVRFGVHPLQKRKEPALVCTAAVHDYREVSDSGGHREKRYVIETEILLGDLERRVEITLTNRDTMLFRMLLGRTALEGLAVIPDRSFLSGRRRHQY